MAKLHSALTNAELHNPKGITVESTASLMTLSQSSSTISASADIVPSTTLTYDLGSATQAWQDLYIATSSINFVRPDGTILQKITATDSGVIFTSGSTGIPATVSGSTISGSALHIEGNGKITGNLTLGGQITMGDADSDDIVFEAEVSSSLIPNNDNAFDLGKASQQWKDIYVNGIGYIDQLGTGADPVTAYLNAGSISGIAIDTTTINASGLISGSSDLYIGEVGGNSISSSTEHGEVLFRNTSGTTKISGSSVSASSGTFTSATIAGGTITGITDLAVADGGTGASTLTDGGVLLGSGTNAVTAMAVLTDGQMIVGDGTTDPVAESGATLRTSIGVGTTDNVHFAAISGSGDLTVGVGAGADTPHISSSAADGSVLFRNTSGTTFISGSSVSASKGTFTSATIAGGTITGITDLTVADGGTGVSTLTDGGVLLGNGAGAIQAMAVLTDGQMIVGDGTTDPVAESGATLRTSIGVGTTDDVILGSLSSLGNISGSGDFIMGVGAGTDTPHISSSAADGSVMFRNTSGTTFISGSSVSASIGTFTSVTIGTLSSGIDVDGDIDLTSQATDIDLIDNNSSALSFDASGKTGILEIVSTDGAERVNLSGGAVIQGHVTASGGISGSHGHFNEIKQNTSTGLHTLSINEDFTVSDGTAIVLTGAGQANTFTMNESLTVGDGNSGTLTYSGASKTLTVEDSATVDQDLTKDADVQFASATLTGRLTAQEIIVSSSVSYITASFASGSNILGDTVDDTHKVTGSLQVSGAAEILGNLTVDTDSLFTLGSSGTQWSNTFTDNVTLDGQGRIDLDDDLDTSIRASADDVITFEAAGADQLHIKDGTIEPETNDDIALGTTSKMFSDLFLGNGGVINFNNGNMTVTHQAGRLAVGGGELAITGKITGSGDLHVGVWGGNSISSSATYGTVLFRNTSGTTLISGSSVSASSGTFTSVNIDGGTINGITDLAVADGGTGASELTDGGILLGSGTNAITAMSALGDGEFIVGDGSGDPVAESGATLRTSIGIGTGDSPQFTDLTLTGGDITLTNAATDIDLKDNTTSALTFDAGAGGTSVLSVHTNNTGESVEIQGKLSGSGDIIFGAGAGADTPHISSSASDGSVLFRNSSGTTFISGSTISSSVGQFTSATVGTFAGGLDIDGDIDLTTQATDIDLMDNQSSALSFDASGKTGILEIVSTNGAEGIKSSGTITATEQLIFNSVLSGSGDLYIGAGDGADSPYVSGSASDSSVLFRNTSGTTLISGSSVSASSGTFTSVNIDGGTINGISDLSVVDGGTGASEFTDGGVLLGSGTNAITAMAALGDGEFIVGDGSGDPVAESGATLRTSIGVGTGDSPQFTDLTLTGGDITLTNAATDIDLKDNTTSALTFDAGAGGTSVLSIHTNNSAETVEVQGRIRSSGNISGSGDLYIGAVGGAFISGSTGVLQTSNRILASGSHALPAYSFGDDVDTGFFLESAADIGVSLAGTEEFRFANGGTFHADADVVAFSSTVASDMNLKENITDTKYGLDTVMQLRGVEYDWKREDMGHDVGVLAQEVEAVIPELVKDVDGLRGKFKAVDYNKLVPILIESIKELKTEVDSLRVLTEVEELK